ncbi:MAG: [Kiritimatiellae bacterium]|nr:[FeFe] hydrogenase H-cluster maturation GTPase HydF [Kiritimatiellia bacterium]
MDAEGTHAGERLHVGFFGRRNAGKSSLVNAVAGQDLAVVSPAAGTTTDPVSKAMELLPLGPVVLVDTPGLDDDDAALGAERVRRARRALARVGAAVLGADAARGLSEDDLALERELRGRGTPFLVAWNKCDLPGALPPPPGALAVSAATGEGVRALKEAMGRAFAERPAAAGRRLVGDLLAPGDAVVLVAPIDAAAPKGRLILPQQQTLRDALDAHATALVCQPGELPGALASLAAPPRLVVTDSQAFGRVARDVPADVPLTSFSILFARYKGDLAELARGAAALARLKDGDRVLVAEGCTHHRQCGDIGTQKLPRWIEGFTGAKPAFSFVSGNEFPDDPSGFALVVHCGGCMLTPEAMADRLGRARAAGVPVVNYGVAIAHVHGVLRRALGPFPDALAALGG